MRTRPSFNCTATCQNLDIVILPTASKPPGSPSGSDGVGESAPQACRHRKTAIAARCLFFISCAHSLTSDGITMGSKKARTPRLPDDRFGPFRKVSSQRPVAVSVELRLSPDISLHNPVHDVPFRDLPRVEILHGNDQLVETGGSIVRFNLQEGEVIRPISLVSRRDRRLSAFQ